jgi:hypothetical protein
MGWSNVSRVVPNILLATAILLTRPVVAQESVTQQSVTAPSMDILSDAQWRQVDQSIDRAIRWLTRQQQRDGSFPTDPYGQPGVTALVAMALLTQGIAPGDGPNGQQLDRAISYILSCQRPNGLISALGHDGPILPHGKTAASVPSTYNHAIAGLALSEAYGLGNEQNGTRLQHAIEQALDVTLAMQRWPRDATNQGGWRYLHDADSDLSAVGWHLKFLRSAKTAGFQVDQKPIDDAVGYILRAFNPRLGTFEYTIGRGDRQTRAMAGAGILALAHSGQHHQPQAIRAAEWIINHPFNRYNVATNVSRTYNGDRYHYGAFYCSQAMYQMGGHYWAEFFPPTSRVLIAAQNADGSWDAESNHDTRFGTVYTTSLAVLALSAPNQLLPIYQR